MFQLRSSRIWNRLSRPLFLRLSFSPFSSKSVSNPKNIKENISSELDNNHTSSPHSFFNNLPQGANGGWTNTYDATTDTTTAIPVLHVSSSSSPPSALSSSPSPPHLPQLLRWLEEHGGFAELCVVSNDIGYEKGRGIFAIKDLSEKSPSVIKVPLSLAISLPNIEKRQLSDSLSWSEIIKSFENVTGNPVFDAAAVLAIFILHEQSLHKKSFYYHWIRYFPAEVRTALYFGQRELEELKGCTEALDLIYAQVGAFLKLDKVRARLCAQFPKEFDLRVFTTERLKWAFSTVLARTITDDGLPTLVPYVDFLNVATELHNTNCDLLLSEEGDTYEVMLNRAVLSGEELTTNYCSKEAGGAEMLCRYGFLSSALTPSMFVRFRMRVPRAVLSKLTKHMRLWDEHTQAYSRDALSAEQSLETANVEGVEEMPYIDIGDGRVEIPVDFYTVPAPCGAWALEVLRSLVIARHNLHEYSPMQPLPYEYEIGVYEKLLQILETRLDQYLTNFVEDMAILKAEDAKPDQKLRSFGNDTADELRRLEMKARRQHNLSGGQEPEPDPEVVALEQELLRTTKSKPDGIEHRLYIHIVRLRMQEKLVLQHHIEQTKKQITHHEVQYERRMRILRRTQETPKP